MKVLMINSVCGIRSTGRICTDLALALEAGGHEVRIAYGRENVPQQYRRFAVRIGSEAGVRLHGVKARLLDAAGFGSYFATKTFLRWVESYQPDVIHLHNLHGYYLHVGLLFDYLQHCGKRVIWTLHDCWSFTGHAAYCEAAGCERWKNGCERCAKRSEYPKSLVDRSAWNWKRKKALFSAIPNLELVTPSKWLAGLVSQSFLGAYPCTVIHNGIDISVFSPGEDGGVRQRFRLGDRRIVFGAAALWDARKGLEDFFALTDILDQSKYRIILVGLSQDQIQALPENVIGLPRTNSAKELAELYAAADAYVNPTYEDNYPTTNLEAIACGTPVISYDTGGSPESAERFGVVVPKGAVEQIVAALRQLPTITSSELETLRRSLAAETALKAYLSLYNC